MLSTSRQSLSCIHVLLCSSTPSVLRIHSSTPRCLFSSSAETEVVSSSPSGSEGTTTSSGTGSVVGGRAVARKVSNERGVAPIAPVASKVVHVQQKEDGRKKVIVLGCGWAGFRVLKDLDKSKYDVTMVSPRNHFLFTPLLASTTVGTLEFRAVMEPVRTIKNIHYYQAYAENIDVDSNLLTCRTVFDNAIFDVKYDELIIAVGGQTQTFGVPGVVENAHFLKEVHQARKIRQDLLDCFEKANEPTTSIEEKKRLLHFLVVGGGPTGVEFVGELHDFLNEDLKHAYPDVYTYVSVTLVEASNTVLNSFDRSLTDYVVKQLKNHKVNCYFGYSVTSMTEKDVTLNDGTVLSFGLCVWSTGVAPIPFVTSLPFKKHRGRLAIDTQLRVSKGEAGEIIPNVYAIGDCAVTPERPLPATAQAATQHGKYIAQLLNRRDGLPFQYNHRGMLAYVGGYRAVSDIPQHPLKGFWSWVFWRSVYATTLVSVTNKVLVPMYWFKSFVFGRDISRF